MQCIMCLAYNFDAVDHPFSLRLKTEDRHDTRLDLCETKMKHSKHNKKQLSFTFGKHKIELKLVAILDSSMELSFI